MSLIEFTHNSIQYYSTCEAPKNISNQSVVEQRHERGVRLPPGVACQARTGRLAAARGRSPQASEQRVVVVIIMTLCRWHCHQSSDSSTDGCCVVSFSCVSSWLVFEAFETAHKLVDQRHSLVLQPFIANPKR